MSKRGQRSFEYILLLGIVLIVVLPLYLYSADTAGDSFRRSNVEDALGSIALASNDLNELGRGNKKIVKIQIPSGVDEFYIGDGEIVYSLSGVNISSEIDFEVLGELPTNEGLHSVVIRSINDGIIVFGDWLRINEIIPQCIVFPPNPNRESRVDIIGAGFEEGAVLYVNGDLLDSEYVEYQDFEWIKMFLTTGVFSGNAHGKVYDVVVENPSGARSNSESFIIKSHTCD